MKRNKLTIEQSIVLALFACATLAVTFMTHLVAPPKVLFGRTLTAIAPSLFPLIILTALALISACFLVWSKLTSKDLGQETRLRPAELFRATALFAFMTLYALLMEPLGFWLSSFIALSLISWLSGNRSISQIAALAIAAPPILYLAATRLLAVSLPELSAIEFFYARLLGG